MAGTTAQILQITGVDPKAAKHILSIENNPVDKLGFDGTLQRSKLTSNPTLDNALLLHTRMNDALNAVEKALETNNPQLISEATDNIKPMFEMNPDLQKAFELRFPETAKKLQNMNILTQAIEAKHLAQPENTPNPNNTNTFKPGA